MLSMRERCLSILHRQGGLAPIGTGTAAMGKGNLGCVSAGRVLQAAVTEAPGNSASLVAFLLLLT